jgi:hypothetical protein
VIAGALGVLALVVVLVAFGVLPGDGGSPPGAAAATTTPPAFSPLATPPPISPAPTGPTATATALPNSAPPVALDAPAQVGDVTVSLVGIEAIQGTATGPGDVAGPALRVTVRVANGAADPLDLLGVAVSMTYGAESTPASPLGDPSTAAFSGTLEPGASADGVYVFRIPTDARSSVTVSVGYQPGAPYAVFTGAV